MRERLKSLGAGGFFEHELLEMLLYPVIPMKDTNELAHRLLDAFGSLKNVIYADWKELQKVKGMTEIAALNILLLPEIFKRINYQFELAAERIDNFEQAKRIACAALNNKTKEEVLIICLDSAGRIVRKRMVSQGGLKEAYVNTRSIAEEAFRFSADRILVAHNHPSGNLEPSPNDLKFTQNLALALAYLDILLLDHIIVSGNNAYSLKKSGIINTIFEEHREQLPQKVADTLKENDIW
ncbi:MAG TPA: DNA repair protein RadC [Clostridia bacterium]